MKKINLPVIVLGLAAASQVLACVTAPAAPALPKPPLTLALGKLPAQLSVSTMDLLTIRAPAKSAGQWSAYIRQAEPDSLRGLSDAEFRHILAQRAKIGASYGLPPGAAGSVATEAGVQLLHFGALRPGKVALYLTDTQARQPNTRMLELQVSAPRLPPSAQVEPVAKQWTEKDQGSVHALDYGDRIEVTLPGSAGDDWDTSSAVGAGLGLERRKSAGAGYVKFVFSAGSGGNGTLVIRKNAPGAQEYRFSVTHNPVRKC